MSDRLTFRRRVPVLPITGVVRCTGRPAGSPTAPSGSIRRGCLTVLTVLLLAQGGPRAEEDCAACHEEVAARFALTGHGRAFAFGRDRAGTCEGCHGPGAAHIEGQGDKAQIVNPATAGKEKTNPLCLACHENQSVQAYWQGSAHETADLRCADCHAVHAAAPSRSPSSAVTGTTDRCVSCHAAQRKALTQRSRHPLREGKMECVSCHNPHGSGADALLRADSVNDQCYSCHQEKRGPFLWEHSPVEENCLTCHTPHGSNHEKLLVARTVQVCQSCHLQGRHQTVAGLPTSFWNTNRMCLNCHAQIHGSNHPSGPLFQR